METLPEASPFPLFPGFGSCLIDHCPLLRSIHVSVLESRPVTVRMQVGVGSRGRVFAAPFPVLADLHGDLCAAFRDIPSVLPSRLVALQVKGLSGITAMALAGGASVLFAMEDIRLRVATLALMLVGGATVMSIKTCREESL